MWILHLLPDTVIIWICNTVLLAGILLTVTAFFIRRMPVIDQYRVPAQVLGIALLVLGVYFRGGLAVEAEWRERVAEVEARLAVAEQKSTDANTKIDTAAKEKIRVIRGQTQIVRQYIDREVVKYDTKFLPGGQCEIPQEFIQAHNKSAERTK
jgi:hypothetical protein